ncbi:PREDICTED: transmembrane protein 53 isoform X2 [Vollenhovia emeryi]|uniref:transmembrane protein 53 isoform X2 n=1 Tax=Vollenhovia emeryi TaxID=411798 RepID=UPI0005F3C85E|nr:PREDICTED: transmembrane protein 53 isoform X2 [Vollenhovia emeryi]
MRGCPRRRLDLAPVAPSDIDPPARSRVSNDASPSLSSSTSHPPGEASSCPAHRLTPGCISSPSVLPLPLSFSLSLPLPLHSFRPREQEARQSGKMSDQEDLDYYIMFPSFPPSPKDPTLTTAGQDQREEFVFVYEEDKRPVVILLGWAGCQDRYLAKYSSIYEEKSCITLRYTAPVECLFWRRDKMPYIGKRLLQVITDNRLDEHPIFFHVFSNGGAFLYQHVSLAMQRANTPFKVRGVIFDSAPGERRLTALFKAISAIIGGHPLTNLPMSFVITFFLSVLWFFEAFSRTPIQTNPIALAEEAYSWPQLFLYSNSDTLIPASDVEKFASRRAERGVRVQLVLFTNSPHVKHYTTYRDVYVNTVCSFIHECLISPSPSRGLLSPLDHGDDLDSQSYDAPPGLTKRVVLPQEASKQQN